MSAVNPHRLVGSLTPSSSADEEGYIVFVYRVCGKQKIQSLKKKKNREQTEFSGLVFSL